MPLASNANDPILETARRAYVSAWRAANASLDSVFYDVGALSAEERAVVSAHTEPEGSVLVVYPVAVRRPIVECTPKAFVEQQRAPDHDAVETVVVAGVGSTAVGTAALARNVADTTGRPVAGIVSGYGLSDVISEAMSGFFVLGAKNAMRQAFAKLLDASGVSDHVRDDRTHADLKARLAGTGVLDEFVYGSPDSTTLLYLLMTLGPAITLLVGHSKGNLSIENALEGVLSAPHAADAPVNRDICIVTLGAVIDFPSEFRNVHQFLGDVDALGLVNSRPCVPFERVPQTWHSLNEVLPGHMTVSDVLRKVPGLLEVSRGSEVASLAG